MFENLNQENVYRIYENKVLDKDCNSPLDERDFFEICLEGAEKLAENRDSLEQLHRVFTGQVENQ